MNNHSQGSDPHRQHPLQTTTFLFNDGIPRFLPISGGVAGGCGAANSAAPLPLFVDDLRQSPALSLAQAPPEATFLAAATPAASSNTTTTTTMTNLSDA